jgi:hypothetical protein
MKHIIKIVCCEDRNVVLGAFYENNGHVFLSMISTRGIEGLERETCSGLGGGLR